MSRRSPSLLVLAAVAFVGCHPTERFESVCQIVHSEVVEVDDKGKPLVHEVELEWDPCPGEQYQVVRGGPEFAQCIKEHAVGTLVPVEVEHFWDGRGFYRWEVTKIAGCDRPPQLDAEGSYEKSQECRDVIHHGQKVGFLCNRKPFERLVDVCPWMARH
ncbi:Hypothetical protein A7982_07858 [Minicystis rosea]|nr:Hypothetical protein A7982_07858 [Minicystis rosea]